MRFFFISSYGYWGDFLPTDLRDPKCEHQVGGGETAMVSIARELAAVDQEVFVFYDVKRPGRYDGVDYLPTQLFEKMVTSVEHDVLVSWDLSLVFRYAARSKLNVLCFQLNDAQIGVFDHVIDLYFHPSHWHAERFSLLYPEITRVKQRWLLTNGIDPIRYAQDAGGRLGHRVIYSSSPDRGLHHLLRLWPAVKKQVSDAELHVFYDMDKWLKLIDELLAKGYVVNTSDRAAMIREQMKNGAGPEGGVHFHGGVGQWQLAKEQLLSSVMCYPCDPVQPTEGFSMSCLEGISSGCSLVTSNADALPELWSTAPDTTLLPLPIQDEVWISTLVGELTKGMARVPRVPTAYLWAVVAKRWLKEIGQCLQNQV